MTKKARFIGKLPSISDYEKENITAFFSKFPVYESCIDWNKKSLTIRDFEKVFQRAEKSRKNMRRKTRINPEEIFKNYNHRIVRKTAKFMIVMPLDWECAVFINSFECGYSGAKWCIGWKHKYKHWNKYIDSGNLFYLILFFEKNHVWGKKIMIQHNPQKDIFNTWLQNDKCIDGVMPELEDICREDMGCLPEKSLKKKKRKILFSIRHIMSEIFNKFKIIDHPVLTAISYPFFYILALILIKIDEIREEALKRKIMEELKTYNILNDYEYTVNIKDNNKTITLEKYNGKSENIIIPETVNNIPVTALDTYFTKNITGITLPQNLVSIEDYAFWGCRKMTNIVIPKGVSKIGRNAFNFCDNLEKIDVDKENLCYTSHEGVLFDKEMTSLIRCPQNLYGNYFTPKTVITLEDYAFYGCIKITSIALNKNILLQNNDIFGGCKQLTDIHTDRENAMYKIINGILFSKNEKELIKYPQGKENAEYIIPQKTARIRSNAFNGCIFLCSIILPENIEFIGDYAFSGCEILTSITFPENLKYTGKEILQYCDNLKTIKLSGKTTTEKNAFKDFKGKIIYWE